LSANFSRFIVNAIIGEPRNAKMQWRNLQLFADKDATRVIAEMAPAKYLSRKISASGLHLVSNSNEATDGLSQMKARSEGNGER
jgi:hypothetical protein